MPNNNKKQETQQKQNQKIDFSLLLWDKISSKFDESIILTEVQQKIGLKDIIPQSETYNDLIRYLVQLAPYPSTEKAQFHRQSNRIGKYDTDKHRPWLRQSPYYTSKHVNEIHNCKCCGLVRQIEELEICGNSFKDVTSMGVSTYLFYQTMINLLSLLCLALLIFGIYALVSNISISKQSNQVQSGLKFENYLMISLGSKIYMAIHDVAEAQTHLIVQVWLGYAMVVAFLLTYLLMERIQVTEVGDVQALNKSAADFTLVFKGVPTNVGQETIQKWIIGLLTKSNGFLSSEYKEFHLAYENKNLTAKINFGVPKYQKLMENYKDYQAQKKKIKEQQKKLKKQVVSWIMQLKENTQFKTSKLKRDQVEKNFNEFRKMNNTISNSVLSYIMSFGSGQSQKNMKKQREKQSLRRDQTGQKVNEKEMDKQDQMQQTTKTDIFVTFESRKIKQYFLRAVKDSVWDRFRSALTFDVYKKKFPFTFNGQQFRVRFEQASQPEDIIWDNIGVKRKQIFIRKFIIFLVTFIILGLSFVTIYALSTVQHNNQENQYISLLVSLVLPIFNLIIKTTLQYLTIYELDTTHTTYQSSLAIKTIIAQLINTIVVPILVNHFIKGSNYLYQKNGLSEDIFFLGLINAFLTPILKIFNPMYIYVKYIKVWWHERPSKKFFLSQKQLNKVYELMEFQTGIEYVYIITLYLFTCFFMSLQPIIILFAIFGYILNYWAQKYCLFYRCKRPVPGTRILYDRMVQFIYAGGLFYSVGSLFFVNIISENVFQSEINGALIANLIALGISVMIIFVPFLTMYNWMIRSLSSECESQLFSQDRIFLPSEYDRMNPQTKKYAIKEYIQFIEQQKKKFNLASEKQKKQFQYTFKRQNQYILNLKHQIQQNLLISNSPYILKNAFFNQFTDDSINIEKSGKMQKEYGNMNREIDMSQIMLSVSKITKNQTSQIVNQPFFKPQQSFHQLQNDNQ